MPLVRLNDEGKRLGRVAKIGAVFATSVVIAGVVLFFHEDPNLGLLLVVLGNSIATIWNLADNS